MDPTQWRSSSGPLPPLPQEHRKGIEAAGVPRMTSRVVETSEARNDAQKAARARARAAETDQDRQKRLAAMRDSYKSRGGPVAESPGGPPGA